MTHQVPQTILAQLGGSKFLAMTGAYSLTGSADSLSFYIPAQGGRARRGVRITLDPSDTYTLTVFKLKRKHGLLDVVETFKSDGLYCDMLAETFTEATGLYTSL